MPVKKPTRKATKPMNKSTVSTTKAMEYSLANYGSISTRTILLLVANTILLLFLLSNYTVKKALTDMEVQRVGGVENYELIQQIYNLDNFKQQQRFQIEQTYQALQGVAQEQMFFPEDVEIMAE